MEYGNHLHFLLNLQQNNQCNSGAAIVRTSRFTSYLFPVCELIHVSVRSQIAVACRYRIASARHQVDSCKQTLVSRFSSKVTFIQVDGVEGRVSLCRRCPGAVFSGEHFCSSGASIDCSFQV